MPDSIFFSWQADTPASTGRNFLLGALKLACRHLREDTTIDQAVRDLKVDRDTQGEAGHPPIVDTILRKIDGARVVVADMTFVAKRRGGERCPNPNVLIEYGWALKRHTHTGLVLVMNTAYGKPSAKTLPFDLRHMRHPTCYYLPDGAPPPVKAAEKNRLATELARNIRACLLANPPPPERIPFTALRGLAASAGWSDDIRTADVGDNNWFNFVKSLRQAAVDGALTLSGRRYIHDFDEATDDQPLAPIPASHFEVYGFDLIQLATERRNYDIFTNVIGKSPRELRGQIYRDLHVDPAQAEAWLKGAGKPPAPADMKVSITAGGAGLGDYEPVASLTIQNIGKTEFKKCFVEIVEMSGPLPKKMPIPLALPTALQLRAKKKGSFRLSVGQTVSVPIFVRRPQRANEWFLIDDLGERHFFSANPTKLILRLYGGPTPGNICVYVNTDASWKPIPNVETIPSDVTLNDIG